MIINNENWKQEIKKKNIRTTNARLTIIRELENLETHPTAYDIFEIVKQKIPNISLATVYRNLELLSREGIIAKLQMNDKQMHFDAKTKPHYHIRCINCGRINDIPEKGFLDNLDEMVKNISNFSSVRHRIEFYGICPECKKKLKS